ncbi:cellulose synthase operon protein C [Klebsiella pneumoniae subsp. ozaenae]|uniref:Cellulose synthase operon protein C n=1 Tax=Klebsiella pneumoniae subsp. ozaenae TaxID=574 RepID=A0A378AP37_KLEPO|nr:cellulose synthase operon protein C [Klebsiella pneumoniae subsp. ozaenae]
MLQVDAPLADGRMFFRTDLVNMDAGSFSTPQRRELLAQLGHLRGDRLYQRQ